MPATTYYVALWGDDGNSGLTWDLAKKSIGGAVTAAASGDTILVAPGIYAEVVACGTKSLTITAIQTRKVFLVGSSTPVVSATGGYVITLTGLVIKATAITNSTAVVSCDVVATDCTIMATAATTWWSLIASGYYDARTVTATRCLFYTTTGALTYAVVCGTGSIINGCTFDVAGQSSGTYALIKVVGDGTYTVTNNIFRSRASTKWYLSASSTILTLTLDWNRYHNALSTSALVAIGSTTYSSLAQLRANGYGLHSSEGDPLLADIANLAPYLPPGSALCTAGSGGGRIGAFPAAFVYSANSNALAWAAFVDTLMTYQSGQHALNDGEATGTFDTRTLDLGGIYQITGVAIGGDETWPTNIFDETNAGAHPEYATVLVRGSLTTFDPDGATPAKQEIRINEIASPALFSARYVQVIPKARSNGA